MTMLVKFFGIVITLFGVFYLFNPDLMEQYVAFWKKGNRLSMGAGAALLIGVIFLLAASRCRWRWFVVAFGILSVAKGLWLLLASSEKLTAILDWWTQRPTKFIRIYALCVLVLGLLLFYSV